MSCFHVLLVCLIASGAVFGDYPENKDTVVLDLYNEKLNFFETFLSPQAIDGLKPLSDRIAFNTKENLRSAAISYSTLRGAIISWCTEVKNTITAVSNSSNILQSRQTFTSTVHTALTDMKRYFGVIAADFSESKQEDFEAKVTISKGVPKITVIHGQLPSDIDEVLHSLWEQLKTNHSLSVVSSEPVFIKKVMYGTRIIENALQKIDQSMFGTFGKYNMISKCDPIYRMLEESR